MGNYQLRVVLMRSMGGLVEPPEKLQVLASGASQLPRAACSQCAGTIIGLSQGWALVPPGWVCPAVQ